MSVCFQLFKKGSTEPEVLQDIDVEICKHFGVEVDSEKWYCHWYDYLGIALACGKTWGELREQYSDDSYLVEICNFLEANYTVNNWREMR